MASVTEGHQEFSSSTNVLWASSEAVVFLLRSTCAWFFQTAHSIAREHVVGKLIWNYCDNIRMKSGWPIFPKGFLHVTD